MENQVPRLNGVIDALSQGKSVFVTFAAPDISNAQLIADAPYDGVVFEMEHHSLDFTNLQHCLQYMLNRRQIVESGTLAPKVVPLVRIPPNGGEMNQWIAKQVLDLGVYGVVWPHVSAAEEARSAVSACRYPRPQSAPHFDPPGLRGDAPMAAVRYWGVGLQDYYKKADVWPLVPEGEIMVVIMCEEVKAIKNLPRILKEVPGISAVLIGEGDLSQDLGYPRQYDHPVVASAMAEIVSICREYGVACGHPHVNTKNIDRLMDQGFTWLMPSPERSFNALEIGRKRAGRV